MVREGEEANNARMAAIDESMDVFRRLAELTIADGDGAEDGGQEDGGGHVPGQQIRSREDEVRNNAGGYVFQVDDLTRVRRFLILGTTGGTYYVGEKELTLQNLEDLIRMIRDGRGGMILREIVEISLAGRSPKQNSLMFALALCARYNVKDRKRKQPLAAAGEDGDAAAELKFDQYMLALHKAALRAVKKVCRIPTHLFMFVKYCELVAKSTLDDAEVRDDAVAADKADQAKEQEKQPDKDGGQQKEEGEKGSTKQAPKPSSSGWGRAMRQCVAEWYLQKAPKELAMHLTKYPNREGWTHRDLLRLAHPMASQNGRRQRDEHTLVYDQLFHYACTGEFDDSKANIAMEADAPEMKKSRCDYMVTQQMVQCAANSDALELIRRVKEASKLGTDEAGVQRCVELIQQYGLVREHIPTELLNSPPVWVALLQHMPMTALLRNLSKLAAIGLLTDDGPENTSHVDRVIGKLLSQEALHRARIHPIAVLLASSVYGHGQGIRGKLTWNPNGRVKKALDECFLLAFKNVQPTGKRFCLALDVSGSMTYTAITGGVLDCCQAAAAMANVTLRTEQRVECVAFCDKLTPLPFTRDTGMADMVNHITHLSFGSTDCALPMVWAREQRKQFDVFIVYTDSETWSGEVKPYQALRDYRAAMNLPHAKLVVMGMAATEFTIADPTDPGMIDIVGLDASVPELLRAFIMDEI